MEYSNDVWFYVLPLPQKLDERARFISLLFSSPINIKILRLFNSNRRLCLKDITRLLSGHSNKSISNSIKNLIKLSLIKEYREQRKVGSRIYYVKCYELTKFGEWYRYFLSNISEIPPDTLREFVTESLTRFLTNFIGLSKNLKVELNDLMESLAKGIKNASRHRNKGYADLIAIGSILVKVHINDKHIDMYYGGGANIAYISSLLNIKTAFIGYVSPDIFGVKTLFELYKAGVDLSNIEINREIKPIITSVFIDNNSRKIYRYTIPALSTKIRVSKEIKTVLNNCKAIYISEIPLDIAKEVVCSYANNKTVVFNPLAEFIGHDYDSFIEILRCRPLLILNSYMSLLPNIIEYVDGFKHNRFIYILGNRKIVLIDNGSYRMFSLREMGVRDSRGFEDMFIAVFLSNIVNGRDIEESIKYGLAAALYGKLPLSNEFVLRKLKKINVVSMGRDGLWKIAS